MRLEMIFCSTLLDCFVLLFLKVNMVFSDSEQHEGWRLLPQDCGRRVQSPLRTVSDRIIGGSQAQRGEFPWMVNIFYSDLEHLFNSPKCGGSVINENYILTAGHCCMRRNPPRVVRVGEVNLHSVDECEYSANCGHQRQDLRVRETFVHPAINISIEYGYAHNDICLIRLQHQIRFNDLVQPICLPQGDVQKTNLTGKIMEFAGWGASDTDVISPSLLKTEMSVISTEQCYETLDSLVKHDERTELCAAGRHKFCYGDSGGPLVQALPRAEVSRYYVRGVASYSTEDLGSGCLDNAPMVFVKVSKYLDWILDLIKP